ncbi:MAG: TraR/DksA family transcriptional regulator [Woeseia sp.]
MPESNLSQQDLTGIRKKLVQRRDYLRDDIERELRKLNSETHDLLADRVRDPGEQSVADLVVDLNLAEVDRDTEELKDVEDALSRLRAGGYGICADCGDHIAAARLKENPAAPRCLECQEKHERRERERHPSL